MGLTMSEKKAITREVSKRYKKASKSEKKVILNEFTASTGYNRCYASHVLSNWGKRLIIRLRGELVSIVIGERQEKIKRKRSRVYGKDVDDALQKLWVISDYLCGKRLAYFIRDSLSGLVEFGEIEVDDETREKLIKISPATIDRRLSLDKKLLELKGKSRTKPGILLKHQIPVRTFSQWDDARPGFVEIDLVSHEGGDGSGDYIQSLNVTDVSTGWTEMRAVKNKAQVWVFEALMKIKEQLPFQLLGIDSDNGSEFINAHLIKYCKENEITFTRGRSYKKNDNCYIEQKNYTVVRKAAGYLRYETKDELQMLNELYSHLRLFINFFIPVAKKIEKIRIGSKIKKMYDTPMTPYRRVIDSKFIEPETKEKLEIQRFSLNPAQLKRDISALQDRLFVSVRKRKLFNQKQLFKGVQNHQVFT